MRRLAAAAAVLAALAPLGAEAGSCTHLNNCNSHGTCDTANSRCICYNGWGSDTDVAVYKAPDCSLRVCPSDRAWVDIPTGPNSAHALAECSNAGICDRTSGRCRCFAGYEGEACQRSACPGTPVCSGHGKCVSMKQMATEPNALPFGGAYSYGGNEATTTWDENKIFGCVCDSAWDVGYGDGEVQAPQWYGADCSLKRCPSGDDPRTTDTDETDCEYSDDNGATFRGYIGTDGKRYMSAGAMPSGVTPSVTPAPDAYKHDDPALPAGAVPNAGANGNKCHVDCANRGICDRSTGMCSCFKGYAGDNCAHKLSVPGTTF